MASRRLLPIVLLALVAGAAAQGLDPDAVPKPERTVTCWDCHQTTVGNSGPLRTFANLIPPDAQGAAIGTTFDYPVQVQSAWSHQTLGLRLTLDLTNAPSVGFASDVPPLDAVFSDVIQVEPGGLAGTHSQPVVVTIPDGETKMQVDLVPRDASDVTGPDLTLLVYPPGRALDEEPLERRDDAGNGGTETFVVANRTVFNEFGYGDWTFVAQARVVPDTGGSGISIPSPDRTIPFDLDVLAVAEATEDRVASVLSRTQLAAGESATLPFRLFAVGAPAPGETVGLRLDLWAHYNHASDANDDDENATKTHPAPILVVDQGGETTLVTELVIGPAPPRLRNGASMATVSEAVGYATAFLLVASVVTGGIFGKASRRGLNAVFGAAKRRVAFHNFLSYGILLAAGVHTALFIVEVAYHWTLGLIWGGIAVAALLGLGVTGAIQVQLIRGWGYGGWRWTHYGLAVAAILFTVVHVLLDGVHFADVQNSLGWQDPLDPRDGA